MAANFVDAMKPDEETSGFTFLRRYSAEFT